MPKVVPNLGANCSRRTTPDIINFYVSNTFHSRIQALNLIMLHCLKVKLPKNSLSAVDNRMWALWGLISNGFRISLVPLPFLPHIAKVDRRRDGKKFSPEKGSIKRFLFQFCYISKNVLLDIHSSGKMWHLRSPLSRHFQGLASCRSFKTAFTTFTAINHEKEWLYDSHTLSPLLIAKIPL